MCRWQQNGKMNVHPTAVSLQRNVQRAFEFYMAGFITFSLFLIIIITTTIEARHPLKILGIFPHPGISHFQFFSPIMRGLAEAGHEVTVISHFPDKSPPVRYKDLQLTGKKTTQNSVDLQTFETRHFYNGFKDFFILCEWGKDECNRTLKSEALAYVLRQNTRYDVIITEQFNTDCILGVAYVLKAPVIAVSSSAIMPWHYERMAAPIIPSYIPSHFIGQSEDMDFLGRVSNWISFHAMKLLYNFIAVPAADALLQYKFGHDLPSVEDLAKETNVFFVNQHFSLSGAKPLPPSVVELGGIHIQKAKALDAELQRFLDNAEYGVVLISWGSVIRAESLSDAKRDGIIKAVKRLKQRVIWKWENETLPNMPNNMLISKWLPQRDILCHPNVKVFMTHAGLMGSSEAVYCGVPVVTTPIYGDQFLNAAALKHRGMGIILPFEDISENSVIRAVKKVLEKQYMDNAKAISYSFKHRPHTALQSAIWWVEYVARTEGAPFTKSTAVYMPRLAYYSLDVYLLLSALVMLFILSWTIIIRKLCAACQKAEKPKRS